MIDTSQLPLTLNGYELRELLFDNGYAKTFLAFQISIKRDVLLTLVDIQDEMASVVDIFIDSAKAKAQVSFSCVCAVYEATRIDNTAYYVQELPAGESLDRLLLRGGSFTPLELAHVFFNLASTQTFYEDNNLNVSSWMPETVFISSKGEARFLNQVEPGLRPEGVTQRDQALVGSYFSYLIPEGQPGSTRVATLCSWLRGEEGVPRGMNWAMVRELAETIILQLESNALPTMMPMEEKRPVQRKKMPLILAGSLGMILIGAVLLLWKGGDAKAGAESAETPSARYALSQNTQEAIVYKDPVTQAEKKIMVDVHEVTIESYARFLKFMSKLTDRERSRYRLPEQPVEKKSYEPEGWAEMLAAAESNGEWNGTRLSMEHPVSGIDFWDAGVYCLWADRRLPTAEEWKAFSAQSKDKPAPESWVSVRAYKTDVNWKGIGGLAGGVSEWTTSRSINPAFPMEGAKLVICGGSFSNKGNVDNEDYADKPELTRPDLGFRTVKDI